MIQVEGDYWQLRVLAVLVYDLCSLPSYLHWVNSSSWDLRLTGFHRNMNALYILYHSSNLIHMHINKNNASFRNMYDFSNNIHGNASLM